MPDLSKEQIEELTALREANDALNGPSFMNVCQWEGLYDGLVRRKLVEWKPHRTMGRRFRETQITDKGRKVELAGVHIYQKNRTRVV